MMIVVHVAGLEPKAGDQHCASCGMVLGTRLHPDPTKSSYWPAGKLLEMSPFPGIRGSTLVRVRDTGRPTCMDNPFAPTTQENG